MTFPVEICAWKMEVPEPSVMTGLHPRDLQDPFCTLLFLLCCARKVPFLGQHQRMPGTLSDPYGSGALESPGSFSVVVTVFPCCAQEGMLPPALATSLSCRHI